MEELDKKIAEWLGWEFHSDGVHWRVSAGASGWGTLKSLPKFTASLDACSKYIVPKLDSFTLYCGYYLSGYIYRARVAAKSGIWREGQNSINPALAFCKAVEKLIDG